MENRRIVCELPWNLIIGFNHTSVAACTAGIVIGLIGRVISTYGYDWFS